MSRKFVKRHRRLSFNPIELDGRLGIWEDTAGRHARGQTRKKPAGRPVDAGAAAVFAAIDRSVSDKRDKRG